MKDPNLNFNKIFAAVLTAGIVAMFAGFLADHLVHPHVPEKVALDIDTSALETASAGGAAAGPTGPEPVLALLAAADVKRGEQLSKACTACHSFDKGGADRVGPNQWNLVNAPMAHRDGFAYSDVLKEMHGKGKKWTYAELNHFIWKPQAAVPGTKMNYLGLKKPEDRAALIAYLRTLADAPAALPSDAETKEEQAAYDAAQPKAAAPAADTAADAKAGATPDAITDKPSADTSSSATPLENSAPESAPVKEVGDSAIPASDKAVQPSANH